MRRDRALRAEVLARLDEAAAEVHLPQAIHEHARRERIARIEQPRASPSRFCGSVSSHGEHARRGPRGCDPLAGVAVDAAVQHEGRRGSGASPITSTCGTPVASSFSCARAAVSARARRDDLRVGRRRAARASCGFEVRAMRAAASSCRNATSSGVRSRLNTRSSSMPLPTRRLLAEARADGQAQERIEHVGRRERQDRAREVVALRRASARAPFKIELQARPRGSSRRR